MIYMVCNQVNGKIYIGATIHSVRQRWTAHIKDAKNGSGKRFHKAIREHGEESFKVTELFCVLDRKDLLEFEKYFVGVYGSYEHGYNSTVGGAGIKGFHHEDETKKVIANAAIRNHAKPEVKRRHKANCKNGPKTESHKQNISTGRKQMIADNPEFRAKLAEIARVSANDPELNKRRAAKQSENWNKPGERERRSLLIKAALARRKQAQLSNEESK